MPQLTYDVWVLVFKQLAAENNTVTLSLLASPDSEDSVDSTHEECYRRDEELTLPHIYSSGFLFWIRSLRLISRPIDTAVTPIVYRNVSLRRTQPRHVVKPFPSKGGKRIKDHIKKFGKTLKLPREYTDDVVTLIRQSNFETLEWKVESLSQEEQVLLLLKYATAFMRPGKSFSFQHWGHCCRVDSFHNTPNFVKGSYAQGLVENDATVPHLFYDASSIEYDCNRPSLSHSSVIFDGQCPSVEKLILKGTWTFADPIINCPWDFSQLRFLALGHAALVGFYKTGAVERLVQLETLVIDQASPRLWFIGSLQPVKAVFSRFLKASKKVHTICCYGYDIRRYNFFSQTALDGSSLRNLALYDYLGRTPDPVTFADLQNLKAHCPNLQYLEIQAPAFLFGAIQEVFHAKEALLLLSKFKNLIDIRLYYQATLGTQFSDERRAVDFPDVDYDDAEDIMQDLIARKLGVAFERITIVIDELHRLPTIGMPFRPQVRPPPGHYRPGEHGRRTFFMSRNSQGVYERGGSERICIIDCMENIAMGMAGLNFN